MDIIILLFNKLSQYKFILISIKINIKYMIYIFQ